MDVDEGVIASAQEYETWEGRPGVGRHCAGCAQDDHALQTCKGPLTREGCLRGCPWCNSVEHSWDECKKKPVSVDLDYYFEVVLRRGRPPIEMKEDWRTKHLARVKAEGGGVSGGGRGRWPWTKAFANHNRARPHVYLGDPQGEEYLADPHVFNFMVEQGSHYSVKNPGPPVAAGHQKPPPRPVVEKKSKVFAGRPLGRYKRKSMEISNESSADETEITKTSKSSRHTRPKVHKNRFGNPTSGGAGSETLTEDDIYDGFIARKDRKRPRKSNLASVPEDVNEKQASEFGKGGFRPRHHDSRSEVDARYQAFESENDAVPGRHRRHDYESDNQAEAGARYQAFESENDAVPGRHRRHDYESDNQAEAGARYQAFDSENNAVLQGRHRRHDYESDNQAEAGARYQAFESDNNVVSQGRHRRRAVESEIEAHHSDSEPGEFESDNEADGMEVDFERECYNCHQPGHNLSDCPYACGRCAERGHKAGGCTVACKCKNFPGHRMDFCPVLCSGIVCKNSVEHRAVDCSVCCVCGSREHHASDCVWKSCPCGSPMNHFGVECDSIEGPCLREDCKRPYNCTGHCRVCGGWHSNMAKWRVEYGNGNCAAERIGNRFKCQAQFCKGTYAWGENCKVCVWRNRFCGLKVQDDGR